MADQDDLAYCSWMEARGDGDAAMEAVQHVIVNRVASPGFPKNVHSVVYSPNQFSWTSSNDPEYGLVPAPGDIQYAYALSIAPSVLDGSDSDNTGGACYYANLKYTTSGWFFDNIVNNPSEHPQTAVIGSQTFYK